MFASCVCYLVLVFEVFGWLFVYRVCLWFDLIWCFVLLCLLFVWYVVVSLTFVGFVLGVFCFVNLF